MERFVLTDAQWAKMGPHCLGKPSDPGGSGRDNRRFIDSVCFSGLIADKAFDGNAIIADLDQHGARVVISQHSRRTFPLPLDEELYKWRHLIENFFCKLKEFKRIAMRADKTDHSFAAFINLAAAVINSR